MVPGAVGMRVRCERFVSSCDHHFHRCTQIIVENITRPVGGEAVRCRVSGASTTQRESLCCRSRQCALRFRVVLRHYAVEHRGACVGEDQCHALVQPTACRQGTKRAKL